MFGVPSLSERQHTPIRARYSRIFEGKVRVKREKRGIILRLTIKLISFATMFKGPVCCLSERDGTPGLKFFHQAEMHASASDIMMKVESRKPVFDKREKHLQKVLQVLYFQRCRGTPTRTEDPLLPKQVR